jgi:hypothetical protein
MADGDRAANGGFAEHALDAVVQRKLYFPHLKVAVWPSGDRDRGEWI